MRNRVVLVTGASSGIGAATALRCAARGAVLGLCARRSDRLKQVTAQCRVAGAPQVFERSVDLTVADQVAAFVGECEAVLGPVDVLVNNAGSGWTGRFVDMPDDAMERVIGTNLIGTARVTRAVLPGMLARDSGTVVMVSSVVGICPFPYSAIYCASKQAMNALAQSLRAELLGSRVAVKIVYPSSTETEFHLQAPLTVGGPMAPAPSVAIDVLRAIERPVHDVLSPSWRLRRLAEPVRGRRWRDAAALALREAEPGLNRWHD